jgi:2-hydroxycyclohexanecarboxyl-CoA dehydrogenase
MSLTIDLAGRLAVVTGAASGIGRAIALSLAEAGATIAAVDRDEKGVQATAERIGVPSTSHVADLTDPAAVLTLRDEVVSAHRIPDILVNAAGWDRIEPFMDNDDELWQTLTAINLLGPVRVSHAFLRPILDLDAEVRIINIASDAGRVGSSGETVYAGTKGGRHRLYEVARPGDGTPPHQRQLRLPRTDQHTAIRVDS